MTDGRSLRYNHQPATSCRPVRMMPKPFLLIALPSVLFFDFQRSTRQLNDELGLALYELVSSSSRVCIKALPRSSIHPSPHTYHDDFVYPFPCTFTCYKAVTLQARHVVQQLVSLRFKRFSNLLCRFSVPGRSSPSGVGNLELEILLSQHERRWLDVTRPSKSDIVEAARDHVSMAFHRCSADKFLLLRWVFDFQEKALERAAQGTPPFVKRLSRGSNKCLLGPVKAVYRSRRSFIQYLRI